MSTDLIVILLVIYAVLNCISFIMFGADKRKAVMSTRRISESALLTSAFFGPFGALAGMKVFRHKTRKMKFKAVYLFLALHLALIALLIWRHCV